MITERAEDWLSWARPASALEVTVTYEITGTANKSGKLVLTWLNATHLYDSDNLLTGIVSLSVYAPGRYAGTVTLQSLVRGFMTPFNSGAVGVDLFSVITGSSPTGGPMERAFLNFAAAGDKSSSRSVIRGSVDFYPGFANGTDGRRIFTGIEVGRVAVIPEPSSAPLLGLGLAALGAYASRRGVG